MKKILVTGASGFLGANLVRELHAQGYRLRVLLRDRNLIRRFPEIPCEVFEGDICTAADVDVAVAGCEAVIHAAGLTRQRGIPFTEYERVNVSATRHIAAACRRHGVQRLVYVSTASTLAPGPRESPGTELNGFSLFRAKSGYINSKYLAQQYILEQAAQGLPAVVVNPAFMIGPHDAGPSSGRLVLHALRRRVILYPPGGKSFLHVQDACRGVIRALEAGHPGDCYLLAGTALSYGEFFRLQQALTGSAKRMIRIPAPLLRIAGWIGSAIEALTGRQQSLNNTTAYLLCLDNYYSGKKAARVLGLEYQPLDGAIKEAVDWFRGHRYC